jgi:hypothetical protein
MTETRVSSDRCGMVTDSGRVKLSAECGTAPAGWPTDPTTGRPPIDLCPPCLGEVAGWLAGPATIEKTR